MWTTFGPAHAAPLPLGYMYTNSGAEGGDDTKKRTWQRLYTGKSWDAILF